MRCKCRSLNRPKEWQTDDAVFLQPPTEHFFNQPTGEEKQPLKPVAIDACLAPVIEHIWSKGIWTINSCCGHNGIFEKAPNPSIVFDTNLTKEKADEIRKIIAEVDEREIEIYSWVFTKL